MQLNKIINDEFRLDNSIIYLNHAAVSPWPKRTAEAVQAFAEENSVFGAKNYLDWLGKEQYCRKQLKNMINAPSSRDIALLKNTSEGLSLVASGLEWQQGENIVSSNEEFPSNRIPWLAQAEKGVEFREVDLFEYNDAEQALMDACDERTRLLTISSIQYGSGIRLDLARLGKFCKENNILFCVDAIQSLGVIPMDVQAINADFVMADAHKWLLGPEGIALFYCRAELRDQLQLHQYGWHMVEQAGDYDQTDWAPANSAKRFECGSPNMMGIFALSASLSLLETIGMENVANLVLKNTSYIIDYANNNEELTLLTPVADAKRGGIVTFKVNGHDNAEIYRNLMKNNVICASRKGGIRFSPHFYTPPERIYKGLEILDSII